MKNEKHCKVVWRNDKNSVQYIEQIVIKMFSVLNRIWYNRCILCLNVQYAEQIL